MQQLKIRTFNTVSENCTVDDSYVLEYVFKPGEENLLTNENYVVESSLQPNTSQDCTVVVLKNLAYPHWLTVPCKIPFIRDIVCARSTRTAPKLNFFSLYNHQESMRSKQIIKAKNWAGLFHTVNEEFRSNFVTFGNTMQSCISSFTSIFCSCIVNKTIIHNSSYCHQICSSPHCHCPVLMFQSVAGGCKIYFSDNFISGDPDKIRWRGNLFVQMGREYQTHTLMTLMLIVLGETVKMKCT